MKLQLLIGPIASGKSTFCKIAAHEGAIIVNDDSLVLAMHGGDYLLYNESLKPLYKIAENTIVQTALVLGKRVVVDRPNHSIEMRRRYVGLAKSLDIPVEYVMMERCDPSIHARRRTDGDSRGYGYDYWLNVAQLHENQYEEPNQSIEGYDTLTKWKYESA